MATGPEHYLEAERLARLAVGEPSYAVLAGVHAQLASVAAHATGTLNRTEWIQATLTVPEDPGPGVLPS